MPAKKKAPKKKVVKRKGSQMVKHSNDLLVKDHKFQPGNEWYNFRTKHGRDILFSTPEILWEEASKYFRYVDDNPWYEHKPMVVSNGGNAGSSVEMQKIPKRLPYTMQGLCMYLNVNRQYFSDFKNSKSCTDDFSLVIARIEETIYRQKFEGASSGFFNSNIIAYDLGLVKKVDVVSNGEAIKAPEFKVYNSAPPLADSEDKVERERPKKKKED
jgi:hypothetical protein